MPAANPLKVAVVGAGGIARAHLPLLKAHPDVELVALADVFPGAKERADEFEIPHFFTDYREAVALADAVLICIPTFLHAEVAVHALEAGKAVFCEKPLARTLEQAEAIKAAQEKTGAPLQVGFVRRFDEEWLAFRQSVLDGKVGRPVLWHDVAAHAGPPAAWFYSETQGGGPFLDGCIHNLDFALATFGPAEWVFCHGRTWRKESDAIDSGTATVRFASGDELMLAWSWALPKGCSGERLFQILGPEGTIKWTASQTPGQGQYSIAHGQDEPVEDVTFSASALGEAMKAQMDEFVLVARGQATPRAGWQEGYESLRLALALLQSARSTQVVHL